MMFLPLVEIPFENFQTMSLAWNDSLQETMRIYYRYVMLPLTLWYILFWWFQCAIPVFDGLLPDKHDRIVGKLLFELATWHGLAKLRLHTETTVQDLENSTARLGDILRDFQKTVCPEYDTYNLPTEEAARNTFHCT